MFDIGKLIHPLRPRDNDGLPSRFTFPFYYTPHPLAIQAAEHLQDYLSHQQDFVHNFGLDNAAIGMKIGKMFGVLVIQDQNGALGYLAAFSGKLADSNDIAGFVPPVYDMLAQDGFYRMEESILNEYNKKIDDLENGNDRKTLLDLLDDTETEAKLVIDRLKEGIKEKKKSRDERRANLPNEDIDDTANKPVLDLLNYESYLDSRKLKHYSKLYKDKIAAVKADIANINEQIEVLKKIRKEKSHQVQLRLFDEYTFLNALGQKKSLNDIFHKNPPSGAGECAAPKLLQYAYTHGLKPIAMAEFWWGASPSAEVRVHQHYYPSCRGKCEPILGFMLQGLSVEDNPMLTDHNYYIQSLRVLYEDEWIVAIDKPAEMLSVPGKNIKTSVYSILKGMYPHASGPLVVHRLDMSTSGILLASKDIEIYKKLQRLFITRNLRKEYTAILDGVIDTAQGSINLPLRVDLDNRPQQMVCYVYGCRAHTDYIVLDTNDRHTLISFVPITGRTHQLRVHAAHRDGLATPIMGDDLYGTKGNRLMLHASYLSFTHPMTKRLIEIHSPAPFLDNF